MFSEDKKWETDAGNISNFEKFDRFVYRNGAVDTFLNDNGKFFIIAAKGLGKTLLLSYKRYLLEEKYFNQGVIFIPPYHPYISFIESIKTTLSREQISKFRSWEYCKKVWVVVIELSIMSYLNIDIDAFLNTSPSRTQRQSKMLKNILSSNNSVEYVFNEIINLSESALTQFVEDVANPISERFKMINQGVIMFFDRLDNALETAHDSIWQPIQAGLLEAAWDVMRSNTHVKIYLSIRQEAYVAHRSRNANAISAAVVKIEYSREELRELLNHLVLYYENQQTLEDFLGLGTFRNTIVFKDEDVFDFMFRYSIGRPRDFVQFCDELSKAKNMLFEDIDEKRAILKDKVREISSKAIIYNLFEELRMLLKCLKTQERFDNFLSLLSNNVLTYHEMQLVCHKFNGSFCSKDCANCDPEHHPFCDLYNMGLLGIVRGNQDKKIQHFKTPYENIINGLRSGSDYFLIHPALREYINQIHTSTQLGARYNLFLGILIGQGVPWNNSYDNLCKVNKLITQVRDDETGKFFYDTFLKYLTNKVFRFPMRKYENIVKNKHYSMHEQRINESLVNFFTKKEIVEPPKISIFVSYAFDSEHHKERVESFVDMLRGMGFDAHMDSSLKEIYPDIDQLMTIGLQMDKIIIVLSEEYKRKADKQVGGVWKEFKMIADDLEINPRKYIFVSFDSYSFSLKEKISPTRIGNRWIVDLKKNPANPYNELVSFIKEEKEYPFRDVNKVVASVNPKEIKPFK